MLDQEKLLPFESANLYDIGNRYFVSDDNAVLKGYNRFPK